MFKPVARPTTLTLLESLVPSLVCRAKALSTAALRRGSTAPGSEVEEAPIIHRKIRDQIMAQVHNRKKIPGIITDSRNTLVAQIQKAVDSEDIVLALTKWQSLETQRETVPDEKGFLLPESTEEKISELLAVRIHGGHTWDEDVNKLAIKFALEAASRHSTEALFAFMVKNIHEGNPNAILALHQKYCEKKYSAELNHGDEGLALLNEEDVEENFDPGRLSIGLAAITAHAMNDSFQSALDTYLTAKIRARSYRKNLMLQHLKDNQDLQQKVSLYLDRLDIAALVSRSPSLSRHVTNLAHPRSARQLEKLYNGIYEGITSPDPYLAADESGLSGKRIVAMTEVGWTSFQTAFIRSERTDLAARLWDDLTGLGIVPGVSMWTALLDTYADLRDSRQAMLTWNMMLRQNVYPDGLSYRAIIAALFDDNKPEDAVKRFTEYRRTFKELDSAALAVYNTVLRGLLRINLLQDANALMSTMVKSGPKPDLVSYNTYLAYYSRQKDFNSLANIVNKMSEENIAGDVVTFSTILSSLLHVGKKDAPNIILSLMHKQGVRPNVATYTSIIDHLMRQQTEEHLQAALKMLDKMEQDESTKPNEVTYTTILSGLYRGNWISRQRADEVRKDVVSRMRRFRISFRPPTYHILIRAALESSDPKGHLDALAYIEEMESQELPRINTTWYILFTGLMHRGLWALARDMVSKMYISGHRPSASLIKLIDEIRRRN